VQEILRRDPLIGQVFAFVDAAGYEAKKWLVDTDNAELERIRRRMT
jgi:hypothetical protein